MRMAPLRAVGAATWQTHSWTWRQVQQRLLSLCDDTINLTATASPNCKCYRPTPSAPENERQVYCGAIVRHQQLAGGNHVFYHGQALLHGLPILLLRVRFCARSAGQGGPQGRKHNVVRLWLSSPPSPPPAVWLLLLLLLEVSLLLPGDGKRCGACVLCPGGAARARSARQRGPRQGHCGWPQRWLGAPEMNVTSCRVSQKCWRRRED